MNNTFYPKHYWVVTLLTSIWVNLSEVLRYFLVVMPSVREELSAIPDVAPIDLQVLTIWWLWDSLLSASIVFLYWIFAQQYGDSLRSAFIAGTLSWAGFFLLFWLGLVNMNLASLKLASIALPLAWVETVVASLIASRLYLHLQDNFTLVHSQVNGNPNEH